MTSHKEDEGTRHPIRVVSERTGITPHVLRAWERRYGVVSPTRSDGGQRFYSDADIRRLSLLMKAAHAGRAVGQVATLPLEELEALVKADAEQGQLRPSPSSELRERALDAVRAMAPDRLHGMLRRALLTHGTTIFLEQMLSPLLVTIGEEWHAGRIGIAQEHAASAAIQRLLGWLIAEFDLAGDAPRVLLATPVGQRHSQGAMMAAATASHDGWRVIWLGADLPTSQIVTAAESHRARLVGLSVSTTDDGPHLRKELTRLREELDAHTPLYVGGRGAGSLGDIDGVGTARDLAQWRTVLRQHAPATLSA